MGVVGRPYKVYVNKYWQSFKTLPQAAWYVLEKLNQINARQLITQGEFIDSFYLNEKYCKRYKITVLFPYTEIVIKKEDKGDWNRTELLDTLSVCEKIYNERI
jgi:hypothetical protein